MYVGPESNAAQKTHPNIKEEYKSGCWPYNKYHGAFKVYNKELSSDITRLLLAGSN